MKSATPNEIFSHWHHSVADFQTSSQEFYATLEQALRQHQLPGIEIGRIEWKEGGLFSARREYLRVRREKLVFDICAAPYGADYYFSWWLGEVPPRWGLLRLAGMLLGMLVALGILNSIFSSLFGGAFGAIMAIPLSFIAFLALVWALGNAVRNGSLGPGAEDAVLDTPFIGWLYAKLFGPGTYYKIDTKLVFQGAVEAVVKNAVNALFDAQGMRPLTELEAKPTMSNFLGR